MPMPTRFGHEFSGDVAAVGEGVTAFAPGDAIMSVHTAPCGECFWCRNAQEELCESIMSTMVLGAYGEYIELPARVAAVNVFRKPADLSYVAAAFLEPLACVMHSLRSIPLRDGMTVLVIGDGGFGLLHAMALMRRGVRPILAGHSEERLALARKLGISSTIDTRHTNLREAVFERTDGRGADAVIECTGRQDVWEDAINFVRRGGTVCLFGGLEEGARPSFSAARMHYDEIALVSPFHFSPADVRAAYDLLTSGTFDPLPLVTQSVPLEGIADLFRRLDAREGIKFAVIP